jgi:ATPase subunit of ABC transporter with duplicated ATPase domains
VEAWTTLSPGERKRWQIAAALAREPEVLLLDEPSNHLDSGARQWLLSALGRFDGVAVVVSHDRDLLDRLTIATLELRSGVVRVHAGSYSKARASWEAERAAAEGERVLAVDRVERLARRLHAVRREEQSASAQRSTRRRMKNRHDSDARGVGAQTRADWAAARLGRRVEVVRRELEQARSGLGEHALDKQLGGSVFARFEPAKSALVAWREAGPLVAGGRVLFEAPALGVRREDRIWLSGENGAGKSTLIGELLSGLRIAPSEVLVLPQDLPETAAIDALEHVRRLPADERGRVLSILATLGVDPERLLASHRPSPGEARKLVMATGLGRLARALVLDEPENHLDLPSIERLEVALAAYPGALLLVTHDAALARRTARTRWELGAGGIRVTAVVD